MTGKTIVTVALPVFNAESFLEECFHSILKQINLYNEKNPGESEDNTGNCQDDVKIEGDKIPSRLQFEIEVSVYEDGSTDSSLAIINKWSEIFSSTRGFTFQLSKNETGHPKGVGYARNKTIHQSVGEYICFCDADDIMEPSRISTQLLLCKQNPTAIIGSKFRRIPEDSTRNFTLWANSLSQDQLSSQVYLSFGPSIVMPTWFCRRDIYDKVGGFDEGGRGVPEDLIFFYKHLDLEGGVVRADGELIQYRYHPNATTFSVTDEVIWNIRLGRLETKVLSGWTKFSIWNAGKLGRRFYRSLSPMSRKKVSCFCDVDKKKITQKWYHPYPMKTKVPIVEVKNASPPFVICVKTELTFDENGDFRKLLNSLNIREGIDYFYFN